MLFNSIHFLFFLPPVVVAYFLLPNKWRWVLLLCASYYFYAVWEASYTIILVFSTVVDYISGWAIYKTKSAKRKLIFLCLSLLVNLGLLFVYKYANFVFSTYNSLANIFDTQPITTTFNLLLPVGISFYTFKSLSYIIDIYRGETKPEKNFGIFALYVSFFPALIAGPIDRAKHLLPQLTKSYSFDYDRVKNGLILALWGMFKKVVIADRLALFADTVYSSPQSFTGMPLVIGTVFYSFQIYCDFSGYSDIALGIAKVFGINLTLNFKRPYFAGSISEFWDRWHISLTSWFKQYVFIPLGGSRVVFTRRLFNILIVFLISGLWHGANWTFVIWGAFHGGLIVFSLVLGHKFSLNLRLPHFVKVLSTFILVTFGWVFFRARSISEAFYVITNMLTDWKSSALDLGQGTNQLNIALISIALLLIVEFAQEKKLFAKVFTDSPIYVRWSIYLVLMISLVFLGESSKKFIYFTF